MPKPNWIGSRTFGWLFGMNGPDPIFGLLAQAKILAQEYYSLTGKPLGVTGEVAEYEAARILGVSLASARQAGYDATEWHGGVTRTLQIKGRCIPAGNATSQRLGSLRSDKRWDAVLMVLLDSTFSATEIWEAERAPILEALAAPGSRARNERGSLSVGSFRSIGRLRWSIS